MIVEQLGTKEYTHELTDALGPVAAEYAAAHAEMLGLHDGETLDRAAAIVLNMLPAGPVSLLAASPEGLALAAVCAVRRADGSDWQQVSYHGEVPATAYAPIVVEPVDGGEGWRAAVRRRYPSARFIVAFATGRPLQSVALR